MSSKTFNKKLFQSKLEGLKARLSLQEDPSLQDRLEQCSLEDPFIVGGLDMSPIDPNGPKDQSLYVVGYSVYAFDNSQQVRSTGKNTDSGSLVYSDTIRCKVIDETHFF